jgi:hypothetical protein
MEAGGAVVDGVAAGEDRRSSVRDLVWALPALPPGDQAVGVRAGVVTRAFAIGRFGLVGVGELCL